MQELIIHTDFTQGSEEWHRFRLGKITGSCFYKILGAKEARTKYLYERVSEIVTGAKSDGEVYTNMHMKRGLQYEPIARKEYMNFTSYTVKEIGLIQYGGYITGSPDGLVDEEGMIEIKVPDSDNYLRHVIEISEGGISCIPKAHYIQMQFYLYIFGRKWCDYVLYNPQHSDALNKGLSIFRVEVDLKMQECIQKAIEDAINTIDKDIARYYEITKSPVLN